ncbi:MAG: hypothetical protein MK110_09325 [Fuerstiella sp.]|nr:hypothetical protein [Fuerstiella sp.]
MQVRIQNRPLRSAHVASEPKADADEPDLDVMFCSGCTTEQRLERPGAAVDLNEQRQINLVDLSNTKIPRTGLRDREGPDTLE